MLEISVLLFVWYVWLDSIDKFLKFVGQQEIKQHLYMAKVNTADVGFEKQIWNAADVLRGSMDAAEYKHVVLGLIFWSPAL